MLNAPVGINGLNPWVKPPPHGLFDAFIRTSLQHYAPQMFLETTLIFSTCVSKLSAYHVLNVFQMYAYIYKYTSSLYFKTIHNDQTYIFNEIIRVSQSIPNILMHILGI